jgi:hypothetical protein
MGDVENSKKTPKYEENLNFRLCLHFGPSP